MLAETLGVLAVLFSVIRSWPQAFRILRRRQTSGVSSLTWSLVLACSATWVGFAVWADVPASAISNAAVFLGALSILVMLQIHGRTVVRELVPVVAITAIADVIMGVAMGSDGPGIVAIVMSILMFLPQVYTAFREDVAGVSPVAWALILLSSLTWGVYGFVIDEWILTPGTFVIVPAAAVILGRIAMRTAALKASTTATPAAS